MAKKGAVPKKNNKLTLEECEEIFFNDVQAFLEQVHYVNGRKVEDDDPMLYVEMKTGELLNLRRNLHNRLAAYFFDLTKKYVNGGIIYDLVDHAKTRALSQTCGQKVVLVKRSFRIADKVYMNPVAGNGKLYRVDREGVIFDRFKKVKALRDPNSASIEPIDTATPATDLIPLLKKVFRMDDDVVKLIAVWLIGLLLDIPVPILVVTGVQGSGKTEFASCLKYVYDPTLEMSNVCSMPKKVDDAAVILNSSRMIIFDNLTENPKDDMLDLICLSYSGGSQKKRTLFTDLDVSSINVFSATVFSAIEQPFKRNDVVSRIIEIRTTPFKDGERLSPKTIKKRIDKIRHLIYGAMFDAIRQYFILHKPNDDEENSSTPSVIRMADFYELGCELLPIIDKGSNSADFDKVIKSNQRRSKRVLAEEDPIIHTLDSILDKSGGYLKITCGELLKKIKREVSLNNLGARVPDYAHQLSSYLKNNKDLLDSLDIAIDRCYSHKDKLLEIKKGLAATTDAQSSVSVASSNPVYTDDGIEEVTLEQLTDNENAHIEADDEDYCEDTDTEELLDIEIEDEDIDVDVEIEDVFEEDDDTDGEYYEEEPHKYIDTLGMLDDEFEASLR